MKRLLHFFPVILLVVSSVCLRSQQPDAEGSLVKWMSLSEALEKSKTVPKPIILDFYTDWCGWCKHMMKTTYANPDIAQYINNNFYAAKFNGEGKDTIEYLGVKYGPSSATAPRAAHNLAVKLMQGKMMYPTTLFLNNYDKTKNEFQFSMLAAGALDEQKIQPLLVYVLENVSKNCGYEDFKTQYEKAYADTAVEGRMKRAWQQPVAALNNKNSSKKKTIVLINTEWCNSCKIMKRTSFTDSLNSKFISEKFDLVDFNPELRDTIRFKETLFQNLGTPQQPFHQLAIALCRNNFILPTMVLLDEDRNLIDAVPNYISPAFMNDIVHFYGEDIYKKKSWKEFQESKSPRQ
jgi:thioredoxin-related protein